MAAWLVLAGLCFATCGLRAHPISLTSALVNVNGDRTTVELGMMVEDLVLYYGMEPDAQQRFGREALVAQARVHEEFLLRYFHLYDGEGRRLEGRVVRIDLSGMAGDSVGYDELMAHSITYHLDYALAEKPSYLTITQDFGGNAPTVPAEMEVQVFQRGARVGTAVMLSHRSAHTVALDWERMEGAGGDDLDAARRGLAEKREDSFGITSYSSVYSFIYITEKEVRHEILIPLLTLESWLPLQRGDSGIMSVEEQRAARPAVFDFLRKHNRVQIDGGAVAPELVRLDFFGPDFRDFARRAPERPVSVYNARVGVVLSFPARETPRQLRFEWDYFDEQLLFLRPIIFAFDEPGYDALFDFYQTVYVWRNERPPAVDPIIAPGAPEPLPQIRLPVWSLLGGGAALVVLILALRSGPGRRRATGLALAAGLLLGAAAARSRGVVTTGHPFKPAPAIDSEQAAGIFRALHRNAYRAFGERDERRIYDALDQSVAGQLLEDFFLQIRRTLQADEEGGAVSRIDEVEILGGTVRPLAGSPRTNPGFEYMGAWTVTGSIEHWGHIHSRKNRFEALFTVEGLPSGWKITGFKPLREEQLQVRIGLRR